MLELLIHNTTAKSVTQLNSYNHYKLTFEVGYTLTKIIT